MKNNIPMQIIGKHGIGYGDKMKYNSKNKKTEIVYFDTEKEAEKAKRKYKKYNNTKTHKWVVQGNALVKIKKKS